MLNKITSTSRINRRREYLTYTLAALLGPVTSVGAVVVVILGSSGSSKPPFLAWYCNLAKQKTQKN